MDTRDCLAHYPFVVIRIRCRVCARKGSYRLARIAAKYGPEITLRDLLDRFSYDCLWRTQSRTKRGRTDVGVYLPDLEHKRPPDLPPGMAAARQGGGREVMVTRPPHRPRRLTAQPSGPDVRNAGAFVCTAPPQQSRGGNRGAGNAKRGPMFGYPRGVLYHLRLGGECGCRWPINRPRCDRGSRPRPLARAAGV
jgi:hypothetical protein